MKINEEAQQLSFVTATKKVKKMMIFNKEREVRVSSTRFFTRAAKGNAIPVRADGVSIIETSNAPWQDSYDTNSDGNIASS